MQRLQAALENWQTLQQNSRVDTTYQPLKLLVDSLTFTTTTLRCKIAHKQLAIYDN